MTESAEEPAPFDAIAGDLRALRLQAGAPSFVRLQETITAQRVERGMDEHTARVPRTTVYDAFRDGRKRVDPQLVGEIVRALGATEEEVDAWVDRCEEARTQVRRAALASSAAPAPSAEVDVLAHAAPKLSLRFSALLLLGCLLLNLLGRLLVHAADLPLDLDMTGTAIAAIVLGPWRGAAVGVATSIAGSAITSWNSVPFTMVEVVGALLWGYGVRRGWGKNLARFFLLNLLVGVVSMAVATPLILWLDGGFTGNAADLIARHLATVFHSLTAGVVAEDLLTNLADKLLSGFLVLFVLEALPKPVEVVVPSAAASAYLAGSERPAARG